MLGPLYLIIIGIPSSLLAANISDAFDKRYYWFYTEKWADSIAGIEDSTDSIKQLKLLMDRYPLEILSKTVWQRKIVKTYAPKPTLPPIKHKLKRAKPGDQFRGKLMNFQKEGLDFLLKSSGNALLADEMGLGKTVQTLSYVSTEKQTFPVLIVAPLVTLNNWEREIEKFLNTLKKILETLNKNRFQNLSKKANKIKMA